VGDREGERKGRYRMKEKSKGVIRKIEWEKKREE
jgi:hypothetical protein